jgi:UDP-galactopyranose mutase
VHFVGRLATYKYYNMDQIVAQALMTYGKIVGMKRKNATVKANGNGKVFVAGKAAAKTAAANGTSAATSAA